MANSKRRCRNYKQCKCYVRPSEAIELFGYLYCNESCIKQYAMDNRDKGKKVMEKEHKQERKRFKENDYKYQFALTKRVAQKLALRLDAGKPCICCSRPWKERGFCGGHYKSSGAHPGLALDLRNIHGQENVNCNMHLSGNIQGVGETHGYTQGLVARYGKELAEYLERDHGPAKYTCQDLIAMRKLYNAEIRRLEKGEKPSRDWRKLPKAAEEKAA